MTNNIRKLISDYILRSSNSEAKVIRKLIGDGKTTLDRVDPLILPSEYDDTKFDGSKVVNGKFCNTLGEYRAETEKQKTSWQYW